MPLSHLTRLQNQRRNPRVLQLWRALQPLKSVVSFMNTGAHPDDETSAMLAVLSLRDGLDISYACANRGEGGQNNIGTETSQDLGALRTAEMERAAEELNMRLYWLSESADDTIFDFGFSKSGLETLGKWGGERTLARFVSLVRTERPDIICPTFLDVAGQHGHHRAMTAMAHRVMAAAADPRFADCDLPVWQVKKLYLPAWSGAGQSYDDAAPPPPATLTIRAKGADPVSGWSWENIGQQSRAFHQTQAMGRWVPAGSEHDWPLHLVQSHVDGPDVSVTSGLPECLADLAGFAGAPELAPISSKADDAIADTLAAFPDNLTLVEHASHALALIELIRDACPQTARAEIGHRLERKIAQLSVVLRIAAEVGVYGHVKHDWLRAGDSTGFTLETRPGTVQNIEVTTDLPTGWYLENGQIRIGPDAVPSDAYRPSYFPADPPAPAIVVRLTTQGVKSQTRLPFDVTPVVLPARAATISPSSVVLNTAGKGREFSVSVTGIHPETAIAELVLPDGWSRRRGETGFAITAPAQVKEGLYQMPLMLDGEPALTSRRIEYPHVGPVARHFAATIQVRVLHARVPTSKVGYIGGGHDRVAHWLTALGAQVSEISGMDFQNNTKLANYDTIIIGIFALKSRAGLSKAMPRLHDWARGGGTLITLYHRPWDNWDADATPPKRLEIGQPSLRWRVTDETAEVRHIAPEHPLLKRPNKIGADDWAGWHKERGLYFAKSWDKAYLPLLEMADPDEAPHRGALLVAELGKGRHIHTSLILHHQMEKLTPGAFRLMANMIA